ncbi:sugar nucleotide-binding protein [Microbulbifer sp. 2201CG32-9]|uniref:sugar nucleotide-binding protein n=1 Tax=Microbulbifer sp. 2201CG32-9 TaxID=3232309 RepID=UPI00345BA631
MRDHQGLQSDAVDIIGAGNEVDSTLQKRLQRAGFRVKLFSPAQVDKLRRTSLVINAAGCAGSRELPAALAACRYLANRGDQAILHLSSYRVFPGRARKRYYEDDEPQPKSEVGTQWLACEQALGSHRHSTVLRLGWMVDRSDSALLGRILRGLTSRQSVSLDDKALGSPVTLFDLGRVVTAMVQQLASGAPTTGIYHYGAADSCTAMEFAREVEERAQSFYEEGFSAGLQALPGAEAGSSVVLDCGRLRDVFGIQQRSWRQGLTRQVELWLERLAADHKGGSDT